MLSHRLAKAGLGLLVLASPAFAQSAVSDTITTTTWTAANSPYRVTGTIIIPAGNTLSLEPGVDVLFDADVQFVVQGRLQAVGTETDSIRFLAGEASSFGGIRLTGENSSVISYARISGGFARGYSDEIPNSNGGGILVATGTHLELSHAVIRGNVAGFAGGGMLVGGGSVVATKCVFANNSAVAGGGGVYVGAPNARGVFTECVFANNDVPGGFPYGASGGIAVHGQASATLTRCTIVGNRARLGGASGISEHATLYLNSVIVWGNGARDDPGTNAFWTGQGGAVYATYSDIGDVPPPPPPPVVYPDAPASVRGKQAAFPGIGNINADPLFADPTNGDYHLLPGSPCIDAGDPDSPPDPDGTLADMGAFPLEQTGLPRLVLPQIDTMPDSHLVISIRATFQDADGVDLAFLIDPTVLVPDSPLVVNVLLPVQVVAPGWQIFANVVGDTVFVSVAWAPDVVTVEDVAFVSLGFRVRPDTPLGTVVPLRWVPYPATNVSERRAALVPGQVTVGQSPLGDVSRDGTISSYDASLVLQYVVRLVAEIDLTRADVSGDGTTSSHDAALIMKRVLDPSFPFPAEGVGRTRVISGVRRTLSWEGSGTSWRLVIDDPAGLQSGQMDLILDRECGVRVAGGDLLSANREGSLVRVAFVDLDPTDGTLLRLETTEPLSEPPRLADVLLNEGEILVAAMPERFVLEQNTPNPFNPRTTIRFTIPATGIVNLAIYDVNGRLVRTLVDGTVEAGMHEVVWDARDERGHEVASGVYLYRLTNGRDVSVKRMTLVR